MAEPLLDDVGGIVVAGAAAVLSPCRIYRYALYRIWEPGEPIVMFIGLNPSTADETADDPTIRRCTRFARDWHYGGLVMANLYAYRATKPVDLHAAQAPVGEFPDRQRGVWENTNDRWLCELAMNADLVVAAWGADPGPISHRSEAVVEGVFGYAGIDLYVLGLTKHGHPRHPLYMRADTRPQRWA